MSTATHSVAAGPAIQRSRALPRIERRALSIWALVGAIVLYLALDGGGYDLVVRNQVGLVVWWLILVGAALGVLPAVRLSRSGWAAVAVLVGFVVWTGLATTWSHSTERSLDELSRVVCYLGIFLLGLAIHRERAIAIRHTVAAVGCAIAVVAAVALLSRLRPGTFAGAQQSSSFLPGTQGRLGWPLNYWNGLGALVALGLPLLLAIATSARRLSVQAIAAGAIPMVALCGYLTFSRAGVLAGSVAMLAFFVLSGDRIPKLLTALTAAAGSAVLIVGAVHRSALENGVVSATARHQGGELLIALILVCFGVALAQVGIGLAVRHGTPPRWLRISRRRAQALLLAALACGVAGALAAGVPHRLSHTWRDFKRQDSSSLHTIGIGRFGSASGNGRYQYWKVSVNASSQHLLGGWGPGTFPLVWLPRATNADYVQNAHSLYFETLLEDGVVGLALIAGLFLLVIVAAGRLAWRSRDEQRTLAAGAAAACTAFTVSAAFDWVWQIPVLPACFLLLAAATLAPAARRAAGDTPDSQRRWRPRLVQIGVVLCAVAALVTIVIPLSATTAVRESQQAAASGDNARALSYADVATRIEPDAASAQLQKALVLELQGNLNAAVVAARNATADEPLNWDAWLVRSRLEAESGHPGAAVQAFRRARSLNPHSHLFAS